MAPSHLPACHEDRERHARHEDRERHARHDDDRTSDAPVIHRGRSASGDRSARSARSRVPRLAAVISAAAVALAGGVLAPATAATTTGWADWEALSGGTGAWTTSIAPLAGGFPAVQMSSDSRGGGVGVISGESSWLSVDTPVGQRYGSSRNQEYLNLRPRVDSSTGASTTTYSFDTPTPASGWTFVLGDIDADQVQVSATGTDGLLLTADELGYRGGFNYCAPGLTGKPSCTGAAADVPSWDATSRTLTGNAGAVDTSGSSGWFEPSAPISTLTLTFTRRAGLPVYQTWFAALARDVDGTVTDVTPGAEGPLAGATLTLVGPRGETLATTTSGPDGRYAFEGFTATDGYGVEVTAPDGKIATTPVRRPADLSVTDATAVDFSVRDIVPAAVSGTVRDDDGLPLGGVIVTITGPGGPQTVVTRSDGSYLVDSVPVGTHTLTVTAPDGYTTIASPAPFEIPPDSEVPVTDQDFVLQAAPQVSLSGTVTVTASGSPVPGALVTATGPGGASLETLTALDGTYSFGDLPPGSWTVTVEPPAGYVVVGPGSRDETVAGTDVTGVDFALGVLGAVSGQVTDSDGTPVAGVDLLVDGPDGPTTLTTDASGGYALDGLGEGTYTVTVVAPDGYTVTGPGTLTVTVTAAGEVFVDQDFVLEAVVTPGPTAQPTDDPTTPAPTPSTPGTPPPGGSAPGPGGSAPRPGGSAPGPGGPQLPTTGGDPAAPLAVATLLLAAGTGTLAIRRRTSRSR